jgi:hypothetical protein
MAKTIMDAFNAAGHFTQQTLAYLDEEQKYKYNSRLYDRSIQREKIESELIADFMRIDENGENVFQQNPELYSQHVNRRLGEWRKEAEAAGDNKPYYMEQLRQMDAQFTESMRQRVDAAVIQAGRQQAAVAYQKEQNAIDNAGWDIERTFAAKMEAHNRYNSLNAMDAVTAQRDKASIYNTMFEKSLNINIGNMTITQAKDAINKNLELLEGYAANYLAEGESLDGFIDNKQESITDAVGAARKAIWDREYGRLNAEHEEYWRIGHDAVRTGDYTLLRYARRLWREGSQLREHAMSETEKEDGEFNPNDRSKIAGTFPVIPGLFDGEGSGGSGGGSGTREKENIRIKNWREYWINNVVEGRVAYGEALSAFRDDVGTLAEETGRGIDELERLYPDETNFFGFFNDAMKALKEQDPGYRAAFEGLNVYINEWKNKAKTPEEKALRHGQGERIALLLFDTILDTRGPARPSPEQIQREAARLTSLLVSEKISFIRETHDNSSEFKVGPDSDKDFGKAVFEMEQHPWARFVTGYGGSARTYTFGDEKYQEQFEESALDKFKTITGIPLSDLKTGHSKEGQFDESAELNIIVTGRGGENGTYRFKADIDGNYWIERQTDNGWERDPRYNMTAREARRQEQDQLQERHAEAVNRERQATVRRNIQSTLETVRNENDPDRRQIIVQNAQSPGDYSVPPDEFWKEGINPNSGSQVKEIPAKDWDRIISLMPTAAEQEAQKRKWRAMGITRREG